MTELVKLDVNQSRELQATILALKAAQRQVRLDINKEARNAIRPLWQQELNSRAHSRMEQALIVARARATASDRGVRVTAANGRELRGGLDPATGWPGAEFGARSKRVSKGEVSKRTRRPYQRDQVINRQFKGRTQHGRIAFDAASAAMTKVVGIWVRTVVGALAAIPGTDINDRK